MHSYKFDILLFLLLSSLLLTLPNNNLISVEATRKVSKSSNGGVFKVDLIHRDSPLSPYYNSSMTRKERLERSPLGYISRGHNIHLSSTHYNTSDLSTLTPYGGGYLMKIAIGTPEVVFFAIADTGSNLIWVRCSPCYSCRTSLDPTKSSTFQAIPCDAPACNKRPDVATGCPSVFGIDLSSECNYQVIYGEGSSDGILAMETISLPSSDDSNSFSLPSSYFGCATDQTSFNGVDGIVGLGSGPSSLISQLGQKINKKFSYCLPPLNSKSTGKLALGADVSGPGIVTTPLSTGLDPTKYYVTLNSITIGGGSIMMPPTLGMFLDSGTTLTYLPARVYDSVRTALETAIGVPTTPSPGQPFDLCYSTDQKLNSPKMVFNFERADVELTEINLFLEVEEGVTCLAMVAASDDSMVIFGNIAQINFQVGYDLQAKQVSFAPTDCTTF